jgi:hypothetical protein
LDRNEHDATHLPAIGLAATLAAAAAAFVLLGGLGAPIAGLFLVTGAVAQPKGSAARFALLVPGVVLVVLSILAALLFAPLGGVESGIAE